MSIVWTSDKALADSCRHALGEEVAVVTGAARASRLLDEQPSHFLVVIGADVNLDDACAFAASERVARPEVGVILLRNRLEVASLSGALRSGIREVVQAEDMAQLADAARRSRKLTGRLVGGQSADGVRAGKVVMVFSAKGGVGKTTLATNVAAYLASMHVRTLIVDLDLMFGDVPISLQLVPHGSIGDLVAMGGHLDAKGLSGVVTTHEPSGLHVLAAPADPAEAERIPPGLVSEVLEVARTCYDYIVVDTPPQFSEQVLAAFDTSDVALLVATLDIPAIKNLRVAMATLDALGADPQTLRVVLNRSDVKAGLSATDVETALGVEIVASIPQHVAVPASVNRGDAIVLSDPRSPVSLAIREVADSEIRRRFGEQVQNGVKRGFGGLSALRSRR